MPGDTPVPQTTDEAAHFTGDFLADNPRPWTMGDGCILDANGRDVPMYADEMLRFVLTAVERASRDAE